MGLFSTPRLAETRAYVAERDAKLWAPILSSSGRKSSSDSSKKSSSNALVPSTTSPSTNGPPPELSAEEYELQKGDVEILACKIVQLVAGMKGKKWNAERVMVAFIRSARRAHARTNCLTEVMFQEALGRARELDAEFTKTGELVGPLHGVPFSVKDHIQTAGVRTTLGFTAWIKGRPLASESASIVQIYASLGGIPLCKTNIPQTMLSFECANPLWGRTSNPHNPAFTSGGSSGGEAALSAADGAAFGIGSDIGGSLRIPIGYCGVWAVKPTKGRFPTHGSAPFVEGQEGINVVFGPIGRCADDVQLLTRVLVEALHPSPDVEGSPSPRDVQRKFNTEYLRAQPIRVADFEPLKQAKARGKPLRIGYYSFEGYSKPSPAVLRAMDETLAALRKKYPGSEVQLVEIDYKLLHAKEALAIFLALTSADGFDQLIAPMQGDKMQPSLYLPVLTARLPRPLLRLTGFLFRYVIRDIFLATATSRSGRKSASEYFKAVADKHRFTEEFDENVWRHYELDAILCPLQPVPAIPHGGAAKLSPIAISTILYNVMDSAVSMVPVTRVDPVKDSALEPAADGKASAEAVQKYKQWKDNETFNKDSSHMIARTLYTEKKYEAENMSELPISIQAVCRPHEEEFAIGIAKLVDNALGPRGFGPGDFTRKHY